MTQGAAHEWLAYAEADLHYAKLGQKDSTALESLIAFHAQQTVEKALKAVLVQLNKEFPRTHDLEQLVELVEGAGLVWPKELDRVIEFTPFAAQRRYPGFDDPIDRTDADEAVGLAEEVLTWAKQKIGTSSDLDL
ncbi:MAG: HEPN domain-containing protein [Verrucomicrobia bacterium]|nr:HEPN domain-containing protein [Verrucomicrobiota bacterium]